MRALGTMAAAACLVVLAACGQPTNDDTSGGDGDGDGGGGGGGETTTETTAVTLEMVGGENWPVAEAGYDVPLPPAPAGFTDAEVAALADSLIAWSQATSLDPSQFSAGDPAVFALEPLSEFTRDTLVGGAEETVIPELFFANAWTDVADYEPPRVTIGWSADVVDIEGAEQEVLGVTLQSRAFYPVTTRAGEETLIAVVRWHIMYSYGSVTSPAEFSANAGWAVRGVDQCALLSDRTLIPIPIAEHEPDEYDRPAIGMDTEGVYDYPYEDFEEVNSPEYAQRCGGTDG